MSTVAELSPFADTIYRQKYSLDGRETWPETARRVAVHVMAALGYGPDHDVTREIERLIRERKFIPGGRYLYASGRSLHQTQNCLLLRAEDSREGWGDLWQNAGMALMTGAGIGVDYSDVRASGQPVRRTGGFASGPNSLAYSINEIGRQVMQGGSRRSAIWAGLNWQHPDIFEFISCKNWSLEMRMLKAKDPNFALPMELTNISVQLDDAFFQAYRQGDGHAQLVYRSTVERMLKTGEPGFSVDVGANSNETLRNACTEVTSADDSDICNLGAINMGRIETVEEFATAVELGTLFLIAGTEYSHVPYAKVGDVRAKNRRLGLGLMGVHEWLLKRGKAYGQDSELAIWLEVYTESTAHAQVFADMHSLSRPVKTRAIAPTGTIAIIGETTTGIEPVFCTAYKRRWLEGRNWNETYVIDPTAARLIESGIPHSEVEDAYALAEDPTRRIGFQAWVQQYVDHGISSTVNLPRPVEDPAEVESFGDMLINFLPGVRGITCYPNGARGGQPITAVSYEEALNGGPLYEETEDKCVGGACGI